MAHSDCCDCAGRLAGQLEEARSKLETVQKDLEYQIADKDMILDQKKLVELQLGEAKRLLGAMQGGYGYCYENCPEGRGSGNHVHDGLCAEVTAFLGVTEKRVGLEHVPLHVCITFRELTRNMQRVKECTACGRVTST